jgi:hypothetical protein
MRFLNDPALYQSVDACLTHLSQPAPARAARRWRGHLFWRGRFGRKQALAVASFLATQPRDTVDLWLWLDADRGYARHDRNRWLQPFLPHLTVKPFDARREAAGTPLADRLDLYYGLNDVHRSNMVRFLILHHYGGLYADMDTMFLRDLAPLFSDPAIGPAFCYQWSSHIPRANSAVMALEADSRISRQILERCRERGSCRPRDVLRFVEDADLDLLILPCAFFDPLWPIHDRRDASRAAPFTRFEQFFDRFDAARPPADADTVLAEFFPGAFTYHWHNQWDHRERDDSYFGYCHRAFDRRFAAARGAATGRPA